MSTQPRLPAGATGSRGGRWAEVRRDEPSGVHIAFADDSELLDAARRLARPFAHQGLDGHVDELVSIGVLAIMENRDRTATSRDAAVGDVAAAVQRGTNEMKLLKTVIGRAAAKALNPNRSTNGAHFKALGAFRDAVATTEAKLGRSLTLHEKRDLADRIRLSMPARRRPTEDFWRQRTVDSIDADPAYSRHLVGAADVDAGRSDGFEEGSAGDRAHTEIESGGGRRAAARLSWDAVAQTAGAPELPPPHLGRDRASKSRAAMAACGGPLTAARRYLDGDLDENTTNALFAPWGDLDQAGRAAVATRLTDFPAYAGDLHAAALRASTVSSSSSSREQ